MNTAGRKLHEKQPEVRSKLNIMYFLKSAVFKLILHMKSLRSREA